MPDQGIRIEPRHQKELDAEVQLKQLKDEIEVIEAQVRLQEVRSKLLDFRVVNPVNSDLPTKVSRSNLPQQNQLQQESLMYDYRGVNQTTNGMKITDGNIMMEGPLDHASGQSPSERYLQLTLDPFKLAVLSRFTAIGHRVTFETSSDSWAGGLSLDLLGEGMNEKEEEVNLSLKEHFHGINFEEKWKMATGAMRENGSALIILHFEGDLAAKVGLTSGGRTVHNFSYMRTPAPESKVVDMDVVSRLDFAILQDDGKGHPIIFQAQFFMGHMSGSQVVEIHHTRCIYLYREKIERSYEGTPVGQPCYNEMVIASMVEKSMGEVSFRWAYGKPVILTKGLTDHTLAQFKTNLGNPTREAWHVLPSEWVEKFELLSNATGNLDLPSYLEKMVDFCVLATGIPKPVMMGDVQGVNTDNTVNNQNYFAVLGKIQKTLAPFLLEFFNKDGFIRRLLQGFRFEFNWGIRFSMSADDKADLETKEIANRVTRGNYKTVNERRAEEHLPPLEEVIKNDPKYAKMLGNSLDSFNQFQFKQAEAEIKAKVEVAKIKASTPQQTMGKTVLGNGGKGKGKGIGHGQGTEKNKIKTPENAQTAKARAISRVKNSISENIETLREEAQMSMKEISDELGFARDTIYKLSNLKEGSNDKPDSD